MSVLAADQLTEARAVPLPKTVSNRYDGFVVMNDRVLMIMIVRLGINIAQYYTIQFNTIQYNTGDRVGCV